MFLITFILFDSFHWFANISFHRLTYTRTLYVLTGTVLKMQYLCYIAMFKVFSMQRGVVYTRVMCAQVYECLYRCPRPDPTWRGGVRLFRPNHVIQARPGQHWISLTRAGHSNIPDLISHSSQWDWDSGNFYTFFFSQIFSHCVTSRSLLVVLRDLSLVNLAINSAQKTNPRRWYSYVYPLEAVEEITYLNIKLLNQPNSQSWPFSLSLSHTHIHTRARAHTHTHTRTHARARARTHTHTHTSDG